jgi:cytochrome c553
VVGGSVVWLGSVCFGCVCFGSLAWAGAPGAGASDVPEGSPPQGGMAGHFHDASLLMLAVAVNDKGGAKDLAKDLASDKTAPSPLREAAKRVVGKVGNPEKASAAVAQLARTCANCHLAGARGPAPHDTTAVPGDDPTERHIMAAMFTWIGLVTPIEQPYLLGLEELLPPVFIESDEEVQEAAEMLRGWVEEARVATSWAERTELYGKVLATCAECHDRARVISR